MRYRIRWDGEVYDVVTNPTVEEQSAFERALGMGWSKLTETERGAAFFSITLRRKGIILSWDDVKRMSLDDFVEEVPEPADEPDPTPAAEPAAPAPRRRSTRKSTATR